MLYELMYMYRLASRRLRPNPERVMPSQITHYRSLIVDRSANLSQYTTNSKSRLEEPAIARSPGRRKSLKLNGLSHECPVVFACVAVTYWCRITRDKCPLKKPDKSGHVRERSSENRV
jgi:hypothetical protein